MIFSINRVVQISPESNFKRTSSSPQHLANHQVMCIWVGSTFWPLWLMLLWTSMYKFLREYVFIFRGYVRGSGIAGSHGNSVSNTWGDAKLFSKMAAPFCNPTSNVGAFQRLHNLANICYHLSLLLLFLDFSHLRGGVMVSYFGFDLCFHNAGSKTPLHKHMNPVAVLFSRGPVPAFCPFG